MPTSSKIRSLASSITAARVRKPKPGVPYQNPIGEWEMITKTSPSAGAVSLNSLLSVGRLPPISGNTITMWYFRDPIPDMAALEAEFGDDIPGWATFSTEDYGRYFFRKEDAMRDAATWDTDKIVGLKRMPVAKMIQDGKYKRKLVMKQKGRGMAEGTDVTPGKHTFIKNNHLASAAPRAVTARMDRGLYNLILGVVGKREAEDVYENLTSFSWDFDKTAWRVTSLDVIQEQNERNDDRMLYVYRAQFDFTGATTYDFSRHRWWKQYGAALVEAGLGDYLKAIERGAAPDVKDDIWEIEYRFDEDGRALDQAGDQAAAYDGIDVWGSSGSVENVEFKSLHLDHLDLRKGKAVYRLKAAGTFLFEAWKNY